MTLSDVGFAFSILHSPAPLPANLRFRLTDNNRVKQMDKQTTTYLCPYRCQKIRSRGHHRYRTDVQNSSSYFIFRSQEQFFVPSTNATQTNRILPCSLTGPGQLRIHEQYAQSLAKLDTLAPKMAFEVITTFRAMRLAQKSICVYMTQE